MLQWREDASSGQKIANHTFAHLEKHVLGKFLAEHFLGLPNGLNEFYLEGGRPLDWARPILRSIADVSRVFVGRSAVATVGQIKIGDVLLSRQLATPVAGVARGFWEIEDMRGKNTLFVHVALLAAAADSTWKVTSDDVFMDAALVSDVLTYVADPAGYRLVLPRLHV